MHTGIKCNSFCAIAKADVEVMSDISLFARRGEEKKEGFETR
jgi:hypothetical protein